MPYKLFDVNHQLVFYGAYHANPINIAIHMIFVPCIIWCMQVFLSEAPNPSFFPSVSYVFNEYLTFELNWAAVMAAGYWFYYLALEPVGALLYLPTSITTLLTATACANRSDANKIAGILFATSWIAQFAGHGVAEKRAPALFDNIIGAFVLAPFFVHLEILFGLGYNPSLHKQVQNGVGKEITRFRRANAEKRRASAAQGKDL